MVRYFVLRTLQDQCDRTVPLNQAIPIAQIRFNEQGKRGHLTSMVGW